VITRRREITPHLKASEAGFVGHIWREVMVVFNSNGPVRLSYFSDHLTLTILKFKFHL